MRTRVAQPVPRRAAAALGAVLLGSLLGPSLASPAEAAGRPCALTIGHRGTGQGAGENSLAAVAGAAAAHADFAETDVRTTADGVPVIMHDLTVDRTTDGTGPVRDITSAQLAGYRLDNGEPVPTLTSFLAAVHAQPGLRLLLEVKPGETPARVRGILRAVWRADMAQRTVLQSFDPRVLLAARRAAPSVPRGYLTDVLPADPVATARALGVRYLNPAYGTVADRPDAVRALHRAGVQVFVWTPDHLSQYSRLGTIRADGMITNRPAVLSGWLRAHGCPTG